MIRAQNLSKYYGGLRALGPVSFEIEDGEAVGFLGLNGAGKTTALRILACDLRPSSGTVVVGTVDALASPHRVRQSIGFLPETPPLYGDMTVRDYLAFSGRLRGMDAAAVRRRIPEVTAVTHLDEVVEELIANLSHGYKQRVGVAQAIVHNPRLLILDEPTRGLDPVQIVEMRTMIRNLKESHTILISSHILTEISQTCDRLLVLGRGAIIGSGSEDELSSSLLESKRVEVVVRPSESTRGAALNALSDCLKKVEGVTEVDNIETEETIYTFDVTSSRDARADICRALVEAGHDVLKLDRSQSELESVFMKLVQGGPDARN
jgi:ABC-2 type transport system ATP-binding protein